MLLFPIMPELCHSALRSTLSLVTFMFPWYPQFNSLSTSARASSQSPRLGGFPSCHSYRHLPSAVQDPEPCSPSPHFSWESIHFCLDRSLLIMPGRPSLPQSPPCNLQTPTACVPLPVRELLYAQSHPHH